MFLKQFFDKGTITNKWHLPVTRVSFGRTTSKDSWAMYTLGPLSCSGLHKPPSKESMRPKSCEGVFKLGHRLNGFYTLWNGQAVHTEYCNLADLATGNFLARFSLKKKQGFDVGKRQT